MAIGFNNVGSFDGAGSANLNNPTSLQFGPDGKLYVSEQNGTINVFTVEDDGNGNYVATAGEELTLANGGGVAKSILNHNDDGTNQPFIGDRQVTGILVAGTAANPVLYVSSSDPRIATFQDSNLDTNSGVLTKVTWNGSNWQAVDLIRGLPRSEENHAVNGMVLSQDGTKLYLTVGGNTNNGAPSDFFTYTGEYALSGTVLEIDLVALNNLPVLTDPIGGQVNANLVARNYVYDIPTLDDPTVPNNGVRENINGLDVAGPWGGNDGFNMAILPADAPFRIYADGFRNHYDLVLNQSGQLYTVDNGSNGSIGGNPVIGSDGQATNQVNNGGNGAAEPLFLIEDGGYYGHPAPARSNQDLPWTVFNDSGNPDGSLSPNSVPNLSALVPAGVNIAPGFLIDPSKFTGDPVRLAESGVRVEYDSPQSNALVTIGSSSNGLVEYSSGAFDGALDGALLVAQFNSNITVLNVNADGTGLDPIIDPGDDGILGTGDDFTLDADGVYPLFSGLQTPLDVTTGPGGTIWVAEIGDGIEVYAPLGGAPDINIDLDKDGILNPVDPFIFDASNGTSVQVKPGQTLLWDFDSNLDENRPGPSGYGGGLTGVMINGVTDFQEFFQEPSALPGQDINLDNVKFITAAGGGTTVVENVSNGDAFGELNNGEFLFHTGVTIGSAVNTFTVQWNIFNPAANFSGPFQEIGGYIGTGDQSNYLKIAATQDPQGEIVVLLEDKDNIVSSAFIQADDLFTVPLNQEIFFQLEINPAAATATPTITYETGTGTNTVSGAAVNLQGTGVLDAILGNYKVQDQASGLAVGLFSTNRGQPEAPEGSFAGVFGDIEITATGNTADLQLSKAVDNSSPAIGDNVTFILMVDNLGPINATGVSVENILPSGFTYVSDTGSGAYNPATGIWSIGGVTNGGRSILNITAQVTDSVDSNILYRVNAGGPEIPALDGNLNWSPDTDAANSPFLATNSGTTGTFGTGAAITLNGSVPAGTPANIFQQERFDFDGAPNMEWDFPVAPGTEVEVRLYFAELFDGITAAGQRVFDVAVEGVVPAAFDNVDPFAIAGGLNTGFMLKDTVTVNDDGVLDLDFIGSVENPAIKGIEILTGATSGAYINSAQILTSDQLDPDSTPGNGFTGEDDEKKFSTTLRSPGTEEIELYRFRNTNFDTGTYLFVGAAERDAILANPDFNQTFELEGNGIPAFTASTKSGENLVPFFRLRSIDVPGTYLFVSTEEYNAIFDGNSAQKDKWLSEGFDTQGVDIPEFYLYGVGAGKGIEFNRFQNSKNGTFLYAGPEETASIINNPALSGAFTYQGGAFESL